MVTVIQKLNNAILKKQSVAVIPISVWENMQSALLDMQEDLEMYSSVNYKKAIAQARRSRKSYSSAQARKKLGL